MLKRIIYLCLVVMSISACGDDDPVDLCSNVDCGTNGECVDGTCECEEGYYGDVCENLLQDLYVGTWSGLDCDGDEYIIMINQGTGPLDLNIVSNGIGFEAVIDNETMFTMPTQTVVEPFFQLSVTVSGDGTLLEDGTLSFTADVSSDFGGGVCTSIMTKQ